MSGATVLYNTWQRSSRLHDELRKLYELCQANDLPEEAENILHAMVLVMGTSSRIDLKRRAATLVARRRK